MENKPVSLSYGAICYNKIVMLHILITETRKAFQDPKFREDFEKWHLEYYGESYVPQTAREDNDLCMDII